MIRILDFVFLKEEENLDVQEEDKAVGPDEGIEEPALESEREETKKSSSREPEKIQIKKRKGDEKPELDPGFYYDFETLVFKPVLSEDRKLPPQFLRLL